MICVSFAPRKIIASLAVVSMAAFSLSGCIVPDVAPILSHFDKQNLMAAVIRGVQCEIRRAVKTQVKDDPRLDWLYGWSAIINLQLNFKNIVIMNPGLSLNTPMVPANPIFPGGITYPVSQNYNLGLGGTASLSGARTEIVDYYYDFHDFLKHPAESLDTGSCYHYSGLSISGNLDLESWLKDALEPVKQCSFEGLPKEAVDDLPEEQAVDAYKKSCPDLRNPITTLSHQIDFELVFGGSITPTWNLVRVSASGSPLFGATRSDHSTLLMTLGPANDSPKDYVSSGKSRRGWGEAKTTPSAAMQARNLSLMIGASLTQSVR